MTMENILEKRKIKAKKNKDESFQLFVENSYRWQVLIIKTSVLSDLENVVFVLISKILPKI